MIINDFRMLSKTNSIKLDFVNNNWELKNIKLNKKIIKFLNKTKKEINKNIIK